MSIINTSSIYFKSLLLLSAMTLVLTTIDAMSEQTKSKQSTKDDVEAQEMKKEWSEAVETLKQYSATQRDEALSQAQQTLTAMDRRIEQLQTRAETEWQSMSKNIRERREETLRNLRQERNELAEWYGGMKYSSDNAWEEVKQGFINAYGSLSKSFSRAQSEFSESDNKDRSKKGDEEKGNKNQ
ncbi:MAG: hypothetical protein PF589_03695 [Gammaproteobacteria bacterium]|jgi:tRNA U34 5-carboxymethylaminomethyl modifying GTPase MnmE/TrmE|nr:hypothetical protein [Gammaproteobacteria bacterium]